MAKLRVYEYAKQMNMSSKEILNILNRIQIEVANHMSVLEEETMQKIEEHMANLKKRAQQERGTNRDESRGQKQQSQQPNQQQTQQQSQQQSQQQNRSQGQPQSRQQGGQSQNRQHSGQSQNRYQGQSQSRQQGGQSQSRQQGGQSQGRQQGQQHGRPQQGQQHGRPQQGQQQNRQNRPQQQNRPGQQTSATQNVKPDSQNNRWSTERKKAAEQRNDNNFEREGKTLRTKSRRFDDDHLKPKESGDLKDKKGLRRIEQANKPLPEKIVVTGPITVGELSKKLNKDSGEIIKKLLFLGIMATINQEIDVDVITLICSDYNVEVEEKVLIDERNFETIVEEDEPATLKERPPVVTIMGHVDHGKTTLLDAIRHTNVTAKEAGGITQHIGAYQVEINNKKITFLDTPGHSAFTTMRARGAQVTDITILVVAADDGVKPQTVEAINHAKAANVPIIVAINKMDKPDANTDRVKQELTEHGLIPEEWGGDTIFVPISALKQEGLSDLMDMILLVAEVQEFKANPDKRARGTVIEAELDRGRGPVATILVQNGTLSIGDPIVVGSTYGRVRAMINDRGRRIKKAGPSTPIEITGLQDVPQAGDQFMVFEDEKKARSIGEYRGMKRRENERGANTRVSLDDLFERIKEGEVKEINVIIKGDVQGSVEALRGSLEKLDVEGVRVKIIHTGVGAITESDVILASASNAIIIGFNVRPEPNARSMAESEKVDVRLHRIIYNVIDEIEAAMKGMLDPEFKEKVIGQAEIRQTFKVSKVGTIAGSYVIEGKITRDSKARVIRDGVVVFEGKLDSLKRFKDDVKEVAQGYECGITLENFNDVKEGDIVEAYVMETVTR